MQLPQQRSTDAGWAQELLVVVCDSARAVAPTLELYGIAGWVVYMSSRRKDERIDLTLIRTAETPLA